MKPKTKRKLKWVVDKITSGDYTVITCTSVGPGSVTTWAAVCKFDLLGISYKTKRQAIAACERHSREKGTK